MGCMSCVSKKGSNFDDLDEEVFTNDGDGQSLVERSTEFGISSSNISSNISSNHFFMGGSNNCARPYPSLAPPSKRGYTSLTMTETCNNPRSYTGSNVTNSTSGISVASGSEEGKMRFRTAALIALPDDLSYTDHTLKQEPHDPSNVPHMRIFSKVSECEFRYAGPFEPQVFTWTVKISMFQVCDSHRCGDDYSVKASLLMGNSTFRDDLQAMEGTKDGKEGWTRYRFTPKRSTTGNSLCASLWLSRGKIPGNVLYRRPPCLDDSCDCKAYSDVADDCED